VEIKKERTSFGVSSSEKLGRERRLRVEEV